MGKQYTNTVIKMEIKFKKIYYMDQLFWGGLRLRPQKQFLGGRVPHPPVIAAHGEGKDVNFNASAKR